jgi:acyl-CoA reductase-like NAD-dependent aldehyde dehydrogenase
LIFDPAEKVRVQKHEALFIGETSATPSFDATIEVISPSTEAPVAQVAAAAPADVDAAVAAGRAAFDDGVGG